MKAIPIDLETISHQQWTVIINNCKYRTTKQTAFFLSPVLQSFSEKHPNLNSCKIEIEGADDHQNLIASILKLRGTFSITLNNYDFLRRFCESLRISLFESQLTEFEEKVVSVSRSVSNEPHIRILKAIERELLRISADRIDKIFDALSRAGDFRKSDNNEVDFKPKRTSIRSPRAKKDSQIAHNSSTEEIPSIPIVKSPLTICAAIFGFCISQPQNIDMYVNLLSLLSNETIEKFKQIVLASKFDTQEESFLAKMMEHQGLIKRDELIAFNKGKIMMKEKSRLKNALRNGLNFPAIDINSIWRENGNGIESHFDEQIGEAFPTFFADLANQKQLKLIASKFNSFELNLPNISKNNWELHKNLSFSGRNEHPIAIAIRKDDVDSLQKFISDPSFKPNSMIKPSIYERFSLMNVFKKERKDDPENGIKFIDFAAFFGALKCFKYLLLNGFEFSEMSFNYAICGGISEIIHICEEKKCQSKGSVFYAIQFHRHDILNWLIDTKGENINEEPQKIARCIVKNFNIDALVNLIQRGFDPSLFVIPAIESRNLLLIEYLATIQHLNFNLPIQTDKKKTIPIINASLNGFNLDIIKFFIKYCKCDINQEGKWNLTPLHTACLLNDEETINFLLQQKKINIMAKTEIFIVITLQWNDTSSYRLSNRSS